MSIPSIRLAGRRWRFKKGTEESLDGAWGQCHFEAALIEYAEGQPPVCEADTILHETFHAILNSQGRPYAGKVEETYVHALATGLIGALRDNPKFASWLFQRLQE